jgi:hypothetical protein
MSEAGPPTAGPSSVPADNNPVEKPRGRKRTRNTVGFIFFNSSVGYHCNLTRRRRPLLRLPLLY